MKKSQFARIAIFFGIMLLLPVLTLVLPKQKISYNENRVLAEFTPLRFSTYLDRSFMQGTESYFSDHFVSRESWVHGKSEIELLSGKKELNSVYICDNQLIARLPNPDQSMVKSNVASIAKFAEDYRMTPYVMLVPTAEEIQKNNLPANAPRYNQKALIDKVYQELSSQTVPLDAYAALKAAQNEPVYYRTDHHWTSLGAYKVYNQTIREMGITPYSLDRFYIEHASHSFKGTLYSKTLYEKVQPDTIDLYTLNDAPSSYTVYDQNGEVLQKSSLYFREYLTQKDQYSVFLGENRGLTKIVRNTNPTLSNEKLLVIKDSYANAILPFFVNHFNEITVIDPRYTNRPLSELVDVASFQKVIFLYNVETFTSQKQLGKLIG